MCSADICNKAIEKYGLDAQLTMVVEECAELINAIVKLKRQRSTHEEIIEEMADVSIMIEQISYVFGRDLFFRERIRKLKRLEKRLQM